MILGLQERLFDQNIQSKQSGAPTQNSLIVCEHKPVYTLGKSGKEAHMLFDPRAVGAELFRTNRGGDITFHGPGQMVVYPIFDLEPLGIGIAGFVAALEDVIIRTVAQYGITAARRKGAPGIWLDEEAMPRKICALGLKASRHCTMHGIALNVNTDLRYFDYIVPCGIADTGVTSIARETGREISMAEVRDIFIREMSDVFGLKVSGSRDLID